jgi:hypothetical protein
MDRTADTAIFVISDPHDSTGDECQGQCTIERSTPALSFVGGEVVTDFTVKRESCSSTIASGSKPTPNLSSNHNQSYRISHHSLMILSRKRICPRGGSYLRSGNYGLNISCRKRRVWHRRYERRMLQQRLCNVR